MHSPLGRIYIVPLQQCVERVRNPTPSIINILWLLVNNPPKLSHVALEACVALERRDPPALSPGGICTLEVSKQRSGCYIRTIMGCAYSLSVTWSALGFVIIYNYESKLDFSALIDFKLHLLWCTLYMLERTAIVSHRYSFAMYPSQVWNPNEEY